MKRMTGRHKGNTIAEYSLIGSSLLLASLALVLVLGQNLDAALKGLPGDMRSSILGAQAFQGMVSQERGNGTVVGGSGPGQRTMCTRTRSGSVCVNVPESFLNGAGLTSTTGSIGDQLTTAQFAQTLIAAASVLNPNDLQRLYNRLVMELANTGHEIGQAERDLTFICRAGRACTYGIKENPENAHEKIAKDKADEIKDKANDFKETKEVLDALLVTISVPPSDKRMIDESSDKIVQIAESDKGPDSVDAILQGTNVDLISGSSNDICSNSDDPTKCTRND